MPRWRTWIFNFYSIKFVNPATRVRIPQMREFLRKVEHPPKPLPYYLCVSYDNITLSRAQVENSNLVFAGFTTYEEIAEKRFVALNTVKKEFNSAEPQAVSLRNLAAQVVGDSGHKEWGKLKIFMTLFKAGAYRQERFDKRPQETDVYQPWRQRIHNLEKVDGKYVLPYDFYLNIDHINLSKDQRVVLESIFSGNTTYNELSEATGKSIDYLKKLIGGTHGTDSSLRNIIETKQQLEERIRLGIFEVFLELMKMGVIVIAPLENKDLIHNYQYQHQVENIPMLVDNIA